MASACANPRDRWDDYVDGVIDGSIPACQLVRLACERHVHDLKASDRDSFLYRFDVEKSRSIIRFFSMLKLTEGFPKDAPQQFVPQPWQQFVLASLFGWVRKDNGLRRFRIAHIMVPRKNGKSHLMAGIGLYMLIADGEVGAQVYSAATQRPQAKFIWDAAAQFREVSGDMKSLVTKHVNSLFVKRTNSKFMALAADVDGLDGLNVHCGLIDELQNHKTGDLYGRLDTSTGSRRQSLLISIATAGFDRTSICWSQHEYGARILNRTFEDETFFTFISEMDEHDDWEDEEVWKKVNPNLGHGKYLDDLRRKAKTAKNDPTKLNDFLRLELNKWTSQDVSWMPMHKWRACRGELEGLKEGYTREELEDLLLTQERVLYGGLDLSERHDLTALVNLYTPSETDPRWVMVPYFFIPSENLEKRCKVDRVPYDVWIKQDFIQTTPGNAVDYDFVKAEILRLHHKQYYRALGVDPHNAGMLNSALIGCGVPVFEVRQGYLTLSNPTKELMSWALDKMFIHLGNPVLEWNVSNVTVWQDAAGNIKPDKSKSRERIDGITAAVTAMSLALPKFGLRSVYSDRGVVTI